MVNLINIMLTEQYKIFINRRILNRYFYIFCISLAGIILLNGNSISQNRKAEFTKEIVTGNFIVRLANNEVDFFSGGVSITGREDNTEHFRADSFYTRYNWDTLIDLNNDGSQELILDLGTGATMYDYNIILIFDFTKNVAEPLEIHNAELNTNTDKFPKIVSNTRLSPNYLGAGYSYSLIYHNGKLILETDPSESRVLKSLDINDNDILELIAGYDSETDECSDESQIQVYYEAYITQKIILGKEIEGWKFFDNYYKCNDKKRAKEELKNLVFENFNYINNPDNFVFKSKN